METDKINQFNQIKKLIATASRVLLICHRKPDGDALGSVLSLKLALKQLGKDSTAACIDDVPSNFLFLPEVSSFEKDINPKLYDLMVVLDCGASYMSKYHEKFPDIFKSGTPVINIDHHPSNDNFGSINIVDSQSASTTIILYELFNFLKLTITRDISTCLLTGIYNDTGSLMHSNTTSRVYQISADLLCKGANLSLMIKNMFKTTSVETLRLWGRALNNIKKNSENITMSVVTKKDFDETGANSEALSGVIDLINSVPNSKFSVLLNEDSDGHVKGSFRTQNEDINLSKIAGLFGGGGHKKAAGFTLPGRLEKEVRWRIVEK